MNLPCTFTRNSSDMVTLILFYRNASHVGQVGAPLYTLDARMMNDVKAVDQPKIGDIHRFTDAVQPAVGDKKLSEPKEAARSRQTTNAYGHHKLMRQSGDKELSHFLIDELNGWPDFYRASANTIRQRLWKRSPGNALIASNRSSKHEKPNSNENHRLTSSIGNVSMVNGISSLMHLLAIKGHLNQSRLAAMISEDQTISQEQPISLPDSASNQTKLINVEKKANHQPDQARAQLERSLFYQLQQDRQSWPQSESNLPERRNQVNNLFGRATMAAATGAELLVGGDASGGALSRQFEFNTGNLVRSTAVDQLENQPQHFVAPQLANRIRLNWPPARLRQYQPYNALANLEAAAASSNSSTYSNRKPESRSQTNHVKSDPLLHFNALLNIKNATEEDAGEYLCEFFVCFFLNKFKT